MDEMQEYAKERNILGYEKIPKLLKLFAAPAIASMLANSLYNIIDQIFIGWAVGYLGIAATTVAFPVVTIVMAVSAILGVGGSAHAAIKLGEGKREDAEKILNTVVTVAICTGIVMILLGHLFLDQLLVFFGATEATMEYSRQFAGVMITICPMSMLIMILANMARADGSPVLSMRALISGVVANVILAPIYIFVFHGGILGAALATTCAQIVSVSILFWYFLTRGRSMRLNKEMLRHPDRKLLIRSMAIGLSSCLIQLCATVVQIVMNNSLLYYGNLSSIGGDAAIGAMGIVMKVNMVFIGTCIGIGIGAQPIIGFNRGAEQYDRVLEIYKLAVKCTTAVTTVGWLLLELFPQHILIIFGATGGEFLGFAEDCMRIFLGAVCLAGLQMSTTSYFQASGQPAKASTLALMRQCIFLVPLILFLPRYLGLYGILWAGFGADLGAFMVVAVFAYREVKKLKAKGGRKGLRAKG